MIAFIPDVRFPSEVKAILDHGGYLIRFGRHVYEDSHPSETSLDNYDFEALGERCLIVDNAEISIDTKNVIVADWLSKLIGNDSVSK